MKKSIYSFYTLLILCTITTHLLAEEPTYYLPTQYITPSGYGMTENELGLRMSLISQKNYTLTEPKDLGMLIPSVYPIGSAVSTIRMNGATAEYTKVLLNGMSLSDPMNTQGGAYLEDILLSGSNIEIIQNSVPLYGTGAVAGVINIIPSAVSQLSLNLSNNQYRSNGSFPILNNETWLSQLNFSYLYDKSRSNLTNTSELDRKEIYNLHWFNTIHCNTWNFTVNFSKLASTLNLDDFMGSPIDDPNYYATSDRFLTHISAKKSISQESEFIIGYQHSYLNRNSINPTDNIAPFTDVTSHYYGHEQTLKLDYLTQTSIGKIRSAIDLIRTSALSDENWSGWITTMDCTEDSGTWMLQDQWSIANIHFLAASTIYFSNRPSQWTGSLSSVTPLTDNTQLKLTTASSFRSPSLYELYSASGSPTLNCEIGTNYSAGIEHQWQNIQLSFFVSYLDINSKIDWVMTDPTFFQGKYFNRSHFGNTVFEANATAKKLDIFDSASVGIIINNPDADTALVRIPKYKIVLTGINKWNPITMTTEIMIKSQAKDLVNNEYQRLDGVGLMNWGMGYRLSDTQEVSLQVNNVTNTIYSDVIGYNTPGREIWLGMKWMRF